jgi:hypothetical protein
VIPTLGIDIGGVIISREPKRGSEDTSFFGDNYLKTPPVFGAFEAIAALWRIFDRRVYLVSKADGRSRAKSTEWLTHHNFFARTGVYVANVRYVYERADKVGVCRTLGINFFVDDREEILEYLREVSPYQIWFTEKAIYGTREYANDEANDIGFARDVCSSWGRVLGSLAFFRFHPTYWAAREGNG